MPSLPPDAIAGLFGKLPARGDFVRENLPRDFTDSWDGWWQRGLADTQVRWGDEWYDAWLEAPVWRFLLPPGINRLYAVIMGIEGVPLLWTYLTLDALAIAMLANDWRTNGKIGAASLTGAAFVFVPQLLYPVLVNSAVFARFAFAIGELSGYR